MATRSRGERVSVGGHVLQLTNLDKVLYPETGTTKARRDRLLQRDRRVDDPARARRPATRKRWVHGVGTADDPARSSSRRTSTSRHPTGSPRHEIEHKTSERLSAGQRPRHADLARADRLPRDPRSAVAVRPRRHAEEPRPPGARPRPRRGRDARRLRRGRAARARHPGRHGARSDARHERQQGNPPVRARSTAARPATRSPPSRTSSRARSRPTIPISSSAT